MVMKTTLGAADVLVAAKAQVANSNNRMQQRPFTGQNYISRRVAARVGCARLDAMKPAWILAICCVLMAGAAGQPRTAPDIFLVTIDTLRADHVHCYGYDAIQTPAIDSLAKDGIRFSQAFTPSPITNTSHTTILTGLLPS